MKIREVRMKTAKLDDQERFYAGILGLPCKRDQEDRLIISLQDSQLIFEKDPGGQISNYHFAFNISSNKLMRAFEWIKTRVELVWIKDQGGYIADFVNWNARSIYFLDPAGNIVELIARFDLNDRKEGPFSPADIYSISEAGLVFPKAQYEEDVQRTMHEARTEYFTKQPPLPGFCALGDDEGLLICVPEGRTWYSTENVQAAISPIALKIEKEGQVYELNW